MIGELTNVNKLFSNYLSSHRTKPEEKGIIVNAKIKHFLQLKAVRNLFHIISQWLSVMSSAYHVI